MTSLFFETFIIQLFVGMLFLMLGIWAGRYLFAGVDSGAEEAVEPGGSSMAAKKGDVSIEKVLDESEKAIASLKDESRQLRTLNEKMEQEIRELREATEAKESGKKGAAEEKKIVEKSTKAVEEEKDDEKEGDNEDAASGNEMEGAKETPVNLEPDDLLKIRGIGKVMAEKLAARGIVSYKQIADWTKDDIVKFSFKSRVKRDKWQTQARHLQKEKYEG